MMHPKCQLQVDAIAVQRRAEELVLQNPSEKQPGATHAPRNSGYNQAWLETAELGDAELAEVRMAARDQCRRAARQTCV